MEGEFNFYSGDQNRMTPLLCIILLISFLVPETSALTNATLCYCDCCQGSSCTPTTTYLNSTQNSCSIDHCYSQCYQLPRCQINNHNGSVGAYCSSDQPQYSQNPQWAGTYVAASGCSPSDCCCITSAIVSSTNNSSLNITGRVSCETDPLTLILPYPTGNTLAFELGDYQEAAMTADNSQLRMYTIDGGQQCNSTLSRSNGTIEIGGGSSSTSVSTTPNNGVSSSSTGVHTTPNNSFSSSSSIGDNTSFSIDSSTGSSNTTSTNAVLSNFPGLLMIWMPLLLTVTLTVFAYQL